MKRNAIRAGLLALAFISVPNATFATPGGLNAQGCHNDRKGGTGYHCHRQAAEPARSQGLADTGSPVTFRNCSAARAAGAAPVRRGSPGYGRHLDRDNDGVGCK